MGKSWLVKTLNSLVLQLLPDRHQNQLTSLKLIEPEVEPIQGLKINHLGSRSPPLNELIALGNHSYGILSCAKDSKSQRSEVSFPTINPDRWRQECLTKISQRNLWTHSTNTIVCIAINNKAGQKLNWDKNCKSYIIKRIISPGHLVLCFYDFPFYLFQWNCQLDTGSSWSRLSRVRRPPCKRATC